MVNFGPLGAEIDWRVSGTPANFNGFRVLASLLQRHRSTEANQTLHDVWPSPGLLDYFIHFRRLLPRNGIFPGAKFTVSSKSCTLLYWQRYCTALKQSAQAKLCSVEHTAPHIFSRATITFGIGPHSSLFHLINSEQSAYNKYKIKLDSMRWFSHRRSPLPLSSHAACTAYGVGLRPTMHCQMWMKMTQLFFLFFVPGELDLWPLTMTFQLGRDFCTLHLTANFHHPTFNRSEVIERTNKHTDKLTNKQTDAAEKWKHPPRFAGG